MATSFIDEQAKTIAIKEKMSKDKILILSILNYRYGQLKTGLGLPSVRRLLRQWLQDIFRNAHKANCFGKFGIKDKAVSGQNIRNFFTNSV